MTDQEDKKTQPEETPATAVEVKAKSSMLKYIIFGIVAMLVVMGAVTGTLLVLKSDGEQVADSTENSMKSDVSLSDSTITDGHAGTEKQSQGGDLATDDPGVMDNIMANLEFLDYEPQDSEMSQGIEFMTREDSVEMANWLEQETKRLAAKEKDLERRERELAVLNKKVEQKLLKVEQIESGRISNLAKLYDDMEPLAVAKLAVNLDDATVVAILPRMKPKNAAQVLAMLPPQRAANLSKMMITIAEN